MSSIWKQIASIHIPSLLTGLVLCVLFVVPFLFVTNLALENHGRNHFDDAVAEHMKQDSDGNSTKAKWMSYITYLGSRNVLAAVALFGVIWQLWLRRYWLAVAWCLIALGGGVLNNAVKDWAQRARPDEVLLRDKIITEGLKSYSYPSGHSAGSTIGYGVLCYAMVLGSRRRWQAILPLIELPIVVAAVGFSRLYLRAHWTTDVIGGILLGLAWLSLTLGLCEAWRRGHKAALKQEPTVVPTNGPPAPTPEAAS